MTRVADGVLVENAYRLAGPGWRARGEWWFDAYLREEAARGLDPVEDLWCPGSFSATLVPGETLEVSAWLGDLRRRPARPTSLVAAARKRARSVVAAAKPADAVDATLALAADAFIVRGPDVVAGYPWFGPWARDTMISYEGLFLHTGRAAEGAALLRRHAAALGADPADWAQDTSDAPLWLVHAVDRHVTATGDTHLAAEVAGALDAVIAGYTDPARPWSARLDPADGLLALGPDDAATTWMNVLRGARPVTPRDGKPVELNALWVNALAALARLRERLDLDATPLWSRHAAGQLAFAKRYPAPAGWLYDVVDAPPAAYPLGGGASNDDPVLRPNQLFAFSLPYAPLDGPDARAVQAVSRTLLTPLGVRTLAPTEYGYHGAHAGPVPTRDDAYHQGTVWPWLIGHHVDACRAVGAAPSPAMLRPLEIHLGEWGLGSVSELADGDPPHRASGCPFSARSVAELIRARAAVTGRGAGVRSVAAP
jgi:predicted glycogen debranching enzyme